jgi:hypothetical protein
MGGDLLPGVAKGIQARIEVFTAGIAIDQLLQLASGTAKSPRLSRASPLQ